MHLETAEPNMILLSKRMGFLKEFSFHLAGGTGLALQIGHRKSFDLDFFTYEDFSPEELSSIIKRHNISSEGEMRSHGTLHCILEGIKSSFIFYDGLLIFPLLEFNALNIADWRDIVAEKLRTVSDRGQKKDFYDLYFGIQKLGIENIAELSVRKFGKRVNYFHLLKGITYFEDADKNPEPMLLDKTVTWEEVKNFFTTHVKDFEKAFGNFVK
jgi:hypothetical protein